MRLVVGLLWVVAVAFAVPPASAECPVAMQVMGGIGTSSAGRDGLSTGPFGALASLDLTWRDRPGHGLLLSLETGATGWTSSRFPEEPGVDGADHQAILLGLERARPDGGVRPFVQAAIGVGRVIADLGWERRSSLGVAISACAGVRIEPAPGPIGLLVALRTSNVVSGAAHTDLLAVMVGLVVHPR
jgi:hypothetical protein